MVEEMKGIRLERNEGTGADHSRLYTLTLYSCNEPESLNIRRCFLVRLVQSINVGQFRRGGTEIVS